MGIFAYVTWYWNGPIYSDLDEWLDNNRVDDELNDELAMLTEKYLHTPESPENLAYYH